MAWHIEIGKRGEELAADFLQKKGYRIIDKNWKSGYQEIDIIACMGNIVAFIEVKTRTSDIYFRPDQAVNYNKQRNIIKAANHYYKSHRLTSDIRFDIISILFLDDDKYQIEHIENAFSAMYTRGGYRRYNL